MRDSFVNSLYKLAEKDKNIVLLTADLGFKFFDKFESSFPDQFFNVGVAEQNMMGIATGLALEGKKVVTYSIGNFGTLRCLEQIRNDACYHDTNITIIANGGGFSYGSLGMSHHTTEDLAILRALPNMTVVAPCDVHEAKRAILWAAEYEGPVYLRFAREKTPVITTPDSPFNFGKGEVYLHPESNAEKKVAILGSGTVLHQAMMAGKQLNEKGIGTCVANFATIKPLDTELVEKLASEYEMVVTVEEHQRNGGLGSAVVEHLSEHNPTKVIRVGVDDMFGQSGTPDELYAHYGMDTDSIVKRIQEAM